MSYTTRNRNFFPGSRQSRTSNSTFRPSGVGNEGRDFLEGLKQPEKSVDTIAKPGDASNSKDIVIKDLMYLGSYNWVEAKQPTIIVPGSAPPPSLSSSY
jgi:hypothetical protein